jgi:hypothetical protein
MSYHDPATLIHATHASRPISAGEELTITCLSLKSIFSNTANSFPRYRHPPTLLVAAIFP